MSTNEKVLFDPGFAPLVVDSIGKAGYNYYIFSAISDLRIKRIKFQSTLLIIERELKTQLSFYLGCLMWALYISQFKNCEIEGNKLLGEACEENEYTSEIDFLIDLIKVQLPRDSKYFQNKNYDKFSEYLPILETYKEFLIINKGFVDCDNTDKVRIPNNINCQDKNLLNEKIQKAIQIKDIESLLDDYNLIFN